MRRIVLRPYRRGAAGLLVVCVLMLAGGTGKAQPPSFKYIPDMGIRIDSVAIAHATLINDTLFLFYNHQLFDGTQGKGVGIATQSSDWLVFDTTHSFFDYEDYFIRYLMPDSTYRKYQPMGRFVHSKSSATGRHFVPDTGYRYAAQPFDSAFGVGTYITAPDGSVHFFYNAKGLPVIACRHAVSPPGDNGMHFHYVGMNVFGDSAYPQGNFFVDPNAILNPDGSISVYLMNQAGGPYPPAFRTGYICSFTSNDSGSTFTLDSDGAGDTIRLKYDDFDAGYGFSETVYSLNDPKVVRLPDGRYRIYVSAMLKDGAGGIRYAIVSATSSGVSGVTHPHAEDDFYLWGHPAGGYIHIKTTSRTPGFAYVVKDVSGKVIARGKTSAADAVLDIRAYRAGVYIVEIVAAGEPSTRRLKIVKR